MSANSESKLSQIERVKPIRSQFIELPASVSRSNCRFFTTHKQLTGYDDDDDAEGITRRAVIYCDIASKAWPGECGRKALLYCEPVKIASYSNKLKVYLCPK